MANSKPNCMDEKHWNLHDNIFYSFFIFLLFSIQIFKLHIYDYPLTA